MEDNARKLEKKPESGFRKRPSVVYAIHFRGRELPMLKDELVVGRSASCDLVLESPLVSRLHARLIQSETGLFIEDLGSRNGIIVNATLVRGSARLSVGDRLRIGTDILEITEPAETASRLKDTLLDRRSSPTIGKTTATGAVTPASQPNSEVDDATRRVDALELLGAVIDKSLALAHVDDAERLLSGSLMSHLDDARKNPNFAPETAARAAHYALKLAAATGKSSWLDYVLLLYTAVVQPLPLPMVDEMYVLLRKVPGMDRALLKNYLAVLRSNSERYSPTERFALKRVEGLERLAGL